MLLFNRQRYEPALPVWVGDAVILDCLPDRSVSVGRRRRGGYVSLLANLDDAPAASMFSLFFAPDRKAVATGDLTKRSSMRGVRRHIMPSAPCPEAEVVPEPGCQVPTLAEMAVPHDRQAVDRRTKIASPVRAVGAHRFALSTGLDTRPVNLTRDMAGNLGCRIAESTRYR
jgi:hypothetical protein